MTFWWWVDDDHLQVGPEHGGLLVANGDGSGSRPCETGVCSANDDLPTWGTDDTNLTVTHSGDSLHVSWDGWRVGGIRPTLDGRSAVVILVPASDTQAATGQLWLVQ